MDIVTVTPQVPGAWSVHAMSQRPVEGVAVYRYSTGLVLCELHHDQPCEHTRAVERAFPGSLRGVVQHG